MVSTCSGLGAQVKQAELNTAEEENTLLEKGVLGEHSPQALVDTVFFFVGFILL